MRRQSTLRRLILAAGAVVGVVTAHALGYVAVFADGAERATHLRETGHGYWAGAVALATAGAPLAVGFAAWWGVRRASGTAGPRRTSAVIGFVPLALAQLCVFAGMEVSERLLAGSDLAGLFQGPLFGVGLLFQVVVAAVAVLVLRLVAAGAEKVAARRRPARRALRPLLPLANAAVPAGTRWATVGCRGPPGLLSSY